MPVRRPSRTSPKRRACRPTKRTPEVRQRVLAFLRDGNTKRSAALGAGISEDTLQRWERDDAAFAADVRKAEAMAVLRNVQIIQLSAKTRTWTAAAWWLERKFPDEWARRERIEHTGQDGGPLRIVIERTDDWRTGGG